MSRRAAYHLHSELPPAGRPPFRWDHAHTNLRFARGSATIHSVQNEPQSVRYRSALRNWPSDEVWKPTCNTADLDLTDLPSVVTRLQVGCQLLHLLGRVNAQHRNNAVPE